MLKPYSTVEETPSEITYEFKTIYLWILYGILAVAGIGLASSKVDFFCFPGVDDWQPYRVPELDPQGCQDCFSSGTQGPFVRYNRRQFFHGLLFLCYGKYHAFRSI